MIIDKKILDELSARAKESPRLRCNLDLRNSAEDKSQRMLNAMEPGTVLPIHRHRGRSETVVILRGQIRWIFYDDDGNETERVVLDADGALRMLNVEKDRWHSLECLESGSVLVHSQPAGGDYDSNFWLCTITIDPGVRIVGQENAYKTIVKGAVGGAVGVIHMASSAVTDCQPNDNVEALRVLMDAAQIEARPVWKPMHKQPCYKDVPCYLKGVSEALFKVGMCLPAGPYVSDEDVRYIVETIKSAIEI